MKICFITHYSELYGANRSLLDLIRYLQTCAVVEIGVIAPSVGPLIDTLKGRHVSVEIIPFTYSFINSNSNWKGKLIAGFHNLQDLFRIYRSSKILGKADLIYSNSSVIAHGLILSRVLRKPHIWHIREYGLEDYGLIPWYGSRLQQWFAKKSEHLVFVSHHLKNARKKWLSVNRLAPVVYNGVFSSTLPKLLKKDYKKNSIVLCFAGLMSKKKNALEALYLLESLNNKGINTRLVVCSKMEGEYALDFQTDVKVRDLGEHVDFRGFVDDLRPVLSECDFLVMPSRNEAMGRVTAEAMSVGVPVIGYRSGGTAELFESKISGIYYSDISETTDLIDKMSSEDYNKMSANAYKSALKNYTIEAYGQKIYKLCNDIIREYYD